jgi:hypothetical protein
MANFSDIFGGVMVSDENPMPGKLRMSTMMNNFFKHESTESAAERAMEGNESPYDESFMDNLGSTRAEEHLARREAQQAMIEGLDMNPTDQAKERLKALVEGWSYQPPQKADEQEEMEEMGMVPDEDADDEQIEKLIRSKDPVKIMGMVLKMLAEIKQ